MSTSEHANDAEILVTGATGFIGRWLLAALTRRGHVVAALVRGASAREAELRGFVDRIGGDGAKLVAVEGDVEEAGLGLGEALPRVRVVYHLAARFAFGLSREQARRTNVDGTRHVAEWAATLPLLERFVFVGGYRMTTVELGSIDAAEIRARYAAGGYEGSKFEAYAVFREIARARSLPWTAVHPAALIGDSRTGETMQLVGLGDTVEKLFEGRLPALVGSPRVFVPVVAVDYLAAYLATVPERAASEGRDLVVLDPASPNLPDLLAIAARHMGVAMPARTLPLGLVRALPAALTGIERESLHFVSEDRYDTREGEAHAAAMGLAHPPLDAAIGRWCDFLVTTRFGRAPALSSAGGRSEGHFEGGTFVVGDARAAEVVMLHGIPFDGEAMAPLAAALGRTSARLDLPGHGRSSPDAGAGERLLERLLEGRETPPILVGHSLGAGVAVEHAARAPESVRALVLVSPAFLAAPAPRLMRLPFFVALALGRMSAEELERRFLGEGGRSTPSEAASSARAALDRKGGARRVAGALAGATRRARRAELREALGVVAGRGVPILIVHAASEPLVHAAHGAEIVSIDGAGNNPHVTHTELVARAVRAFLDARAPQRGVARRGPPAPELREHRHAEATARDMAGACLPAQSPFPGRTPRSSPRSTAPARASTTRSSST